MSNAIRFSSVTLACPDPAGLASFYADVTGGEVTFVHHMEWASMRCEGVRLEFMGVADYVPPRWPDDSALLHIDFLVDDLEKAATRVERSGPRVSTISRTRLIAWCSAILQAIRFVSH
ncbi:MAG TPA: VOC family protein [Nocardioides sp.]|nr:VOC family protein [Nocardioides sp.]HXH77462.1 VOC family protein [Nocardioides sp.]